ncbi:MAG: UDP-N-acetylmuramoyl-L-alanine--D-glutamate ligase [Deltaproteobacteria bacterium]
MFRGTHALVVGAGKSGFVSALRLVERGAAVTLWDERPREAVERDLGQPIPARVAFVRGEVPPKAARGADLVILSPGVPREKLPLAELSRRGTPIWGELELGYRLFAGKVAAVTGTNGKSTVTTLVGEMAKKAFPRVFVGGNLGVPFTAAAGEEWDWAVIEASSFQLESIDSFRPRVAVLLNLTEDHRDRYPDFAAYAAAKMRIFRNVEGTETAVLSGDDPEVRRRAPEVRAAVLFVSLAGPVDRGAFLEGEEILFRDGGTEERYPRSLLRIRGVQNLENGMASVAAARSMGVPAEAVREVLRTFPGLPHRVEFVREVRGVSYVNDSKGTNVGAVLRCLEGFAGPVVLIAGGKDKGIDFRPLAAALSRKARAAILIGEARERMRREIGGAVPVRLADSLEEAVRAAAGEARPGDAVVLSPACSSFDMFRGFEERGEAFRAAVRRLPS